jgi:hypothetical protein
MMKFRIATLQNERGSIGLAILFILLISFIGLSMLGHVITHQRIVRARTRKTVQTDRLYQHLILYLHQLRDTVFSGEWQKFAEPEQDYFNQAHFPDEQNRDIEMKNSFYHSCTDRQIYRKITIDHTVTALSIRHPYRLQAGVTVELLCGRIPLTFFPFFLNQKIDIPENTFLKENRITITDEPRPIISDMDSEFNTAEFLLHSLKIQGSCLDWRYIREKFGLPPSDAPIEGGIYFIIEGDCIESIFIQGDVEGLVFSTLNENQIIRLTRQGQDYEISYKPGEYDFLCPDNWITGPYLFQEKIIVNGNLWSLAQENDYAFLEQTALTLLVSGQTVIHSSLKTRGDSLNLKKFKSTGLTLIASGHGLYTSADGQSKVTIADSAKTELDLSLMINGKVTNRSSDLKISGSLFARDLENTGSIEIAFRQSNLDPAEYFITTDFKYIQRFFIDFIEEVYP